jgi:hypothetical protein
VRIWPVIARACGHRERVARSRRNLMQRDGNNDDTTEAEVWAMRRGRKLKILRRRLKFLEGRVASWRYQLGTEPTNDIAEIKALTWALEILTPTDDDE